MEVVQAYLNVEGGYRYLASKYNIPAKRRIEEWVHAYREFGEEGLMRSRQNKKYTFQFKLFYGSRIAFIKWEWGFISGISTITRN